MACRIGCALWRLRTLIGSCWCGEFGTSAPYLNEFRWQRQPLESLGIGRNFALDRERRISFQIRAEFQNIFNRLFLASPVSVSSGSLGFNATAGANPVAPVTSENGRLKGGYGYVVAETLLRRVIQQAGLRNTLGRGGPRVHDLRHTFVVHRMTEWYRQGINPQGHLPYLAAYLGHRDIHSTLVYLTITQELLQRANERFRTAETEVLRVIKGE